MSKSLFLPIFWVFSVCALLGTCKEAAWEGQSYDSLSLSSRSEFQNLLSCAASVFVSHSLNVAPSLGLGIANRLAWCVKRAVTIVHGMKARYAAETAENSSLCSTPWRSHFGHCVLWCINIGHIFCSSQIANNSETKSEVSYVTGWWSWERASCCALFYAWENFD